MLSLLCILEKESWYEIMLYVSTRGKTDMVSSAHAIASGLAADGGLFMPLEFSALSMTEICAMQDLPYGDRAVTVLSKFLTDFSEAELQECVTKAYSKEKFGGFPVPLHPVKENAAVLELWHGPTSAFKDMALQILPLLLTKAVVKTGESKKLVILVATSGDTGKAALAGFADVPGTEVIVFYPDNGVSAMQKRQMITQQGDNVHVVAVKGNFDDAQTGVKKLFADQKLTGLLKQSNLAFSSANSINWGRLVPQIVYYFSAYADAVKAGLIKAGDAINFSVPTGNFGDILAGYFAKIMGLPVHKFICASNSNNVLTDFLNTGEYNRKRKFFKTVSPSMDILVSSNLERLLYVETDHDAAMVDKWMNQLATEGSYKVGQKLQNKILEDFFGAWVDEEETKETIGSVYNSYNYLMDPHTSVAWRAMEKYRLLTSDDRFCVVLSTASPFKFNDTVLKAIEPDKDFGTLKTFDALRKLAEISKLPVPEKMAELENLPVKHFDVIETGNMENKVKEILQIK